MRRQLGTKRCKRCTRILQSARFSRVCYRTCDVPHHDINPSTLSMHNYSFQVDYILYTVPGTTPSGNIRKIGLVIENHNGAYISGQSGMSKYSRNFPTAVTHRPPQPEKKRPVHMTRTPTRTSKTSLTRRYMPSRYTSPSIKMPHSPPQNPGWPTPPYETSRPRTHTLPSIKRHILLLKTPAGSLHRTKTRRAVPAHPLPPLNTPHFPLHNPSQSKVHRILP